MADFTNDITVNILDENTISLNVVEQTIEITAEIAAPPSGVAPGVMLVDYSIKAQVADVSGDYLANLDNGNSFQLTLIDDVDITDITGWPGTEEEGKATFYIIQGAGPFALSWPPSIQWVNSAHGAIGTVAGSTDVFVLTSLDAGSTIFGFHVGST
jgi:hypothetical protein